MSRITLVDVGEGKRIGTIGAPVRLDKHHLHIECFHDPEGRPTVIVESHTLSHAELMRTAHRELDQFIRESTYRAQQRIRGNKGVEIKRENRARKKLSRANAVLVAACTDQRRKHPELSLRAIAKNLTPRFADQTLKNPTEALRKRIARLVNDQAPDRAPGR